MKYQDAPADAVESERRLGLLVALVIFNVVLSGSFQEALFLSYHPSSRIPLAMLLGSVVTAGTALLTSRALQRREPWLALQATLLFLGLLCAGGALWNLHPSAASTFALFLFVELSTTLGVAATWNYCQAPLSPSQLRKFLPRLGMYSGVGGLLAGIAIPLVMRVFPSPQGLVIVAAASWIGAGLMVRRGAPPKRKSHKEQAQPSLGQLFRIPLARWVTVGTAGIVWMGLLVKYQTRVDMKATMTPPQIMRTMSMLLSASSVAGIAVQALLTNRILERWGVGLALAVLPVSVALLLGSYLLGHALMTIAAAFFLDKALRPNLHRPAESCMLAALSPATRPVLLLTLSGVLVPLLLATGSLLLWGLTLIERSRPEWHPWIIPVFALVLAAGLVVLSSRWGPLYSRTLRETLQEGSVDSASAPDPGARELLGADDGSAQAVVFQTIDGPRLRMLLDSIDSGSPRVRELALELLRPHRSDLVEKEMLARAAHPLAAVRIIALRWLSDEPPGPDLWALLQKRWHDRIVSDAERIALIQAAGPRAVQLLSADLQTFMRASSLELRSAAIRALLGTEDPEYHRLAQECVAAWLQSAAPEERCAGLHLVRDGRIGAFLPDVLGRLLDPDLGVRRDAISCLPIFDHPEARRALWTALDEPLTAHAAARALSACGLPILPEIIVRLRAEKPAAPFAQLDRKARLHLLRVLGQIPSREAIPCLLLQLADPAPEVQLHSLKSLNQLRRHDPGAPMDPPVLRDFILQQLRAGLHLLLCHDLLGDHLRPSGLLRRELEFQIESARQRVSQALQLLSPPDTMAPILRALRSSVFYQRDQARELLKTSLRAPFLSAIRVGSLKLLDGSTPWSEECYRPPLAIQVGQRTHDAVAWLAAVKDPWLVSALLHDTHCPRGDVPISLAEDPMEPSLDRILFLKDVALFEALTNQQLAAVARLAEDVEFAAGKTLFTQGEASDCLYLVRAGKLRVLISDQEVARLGPGECAGEMGVLEGTERSGTVETLTPCHLLRFDSDDFLALLESYPEIGRGLLKSMVRRLARAGRPKKEHPATITGMLPGQDEPPLRPPR